MTVSEFMTE